MRLSPKKIETLARVIRRSLEQTAGLELAESPEAIEMLIRQVITDDLRMEDEIEEEARRLLDQHADQIQMRGASYDALLRKTKAKLAQDRKMVL